jgi:hypothetical protein
MSLPSEKPEKGAESACPFPLDLPQEDFDREFFGQVLRHGDSNSDVVRRQAELLARHGDYDDACQLDQLLTERFPDDPVVHYNLACSLSMSGRLDLALAALRRAIELGYGDLGHLATDTDLDPLRDLPGFQALLPGRERPPK